MTIQDNTYYLINYKDKTTLARVATTSLSNNIDSPGLYGYEPAYYLFLVDKNLGIWIYESELTKIILRPIQDKELEVYQALFS